MVLIANSSSFPYPIIAIAVRCSGRRVQKEWAMAVEAVEKKNQW